MRSLLPFVITGLATGSLYGLAGLGLVLTYRTSGVFNFGHGAIAAGAAFLFYTLHFIHGLAWPLAGVITIVLFATVVGFAMERITRGLRDAPQAVGVVATVGIVLGIQGYLHLQYGLETRQFPEFLPTSGFTLQGVNVTWAQVISAVVAAGSALMLYVFLRRSRLGVTMRGVVDNPTLIHLSGERPARVRQAAWSIGSAFAALSGILLAPTLNLDVHLLTLLVVQAFGACAIGLFTSLPLTYVGGLVVGVASSVATKYFTEPPLSGVPSTVPYLVLIAVLLVVPMAKLPQRRASVRALVAEAPPLSARRRAALTAMGGGLLLVPAVVGPKLPVWTTALSYSVIFGSLALLVWTSGQISLCHATFAAIGATTMAHLAGSQQLPWLVALVLAGLATVPVGALVAIPAIRLSGIYLALITLGFGILMQNVIYPTSLMFGRDLLVSAPRPEMGFIDGNNDSWLYYVVFAVSVLVWIALAAISRGRIGRLLRAMAETPTMLSTHGLEVGVTRLIVFCISAFFAGIGGALAITQTQSAGGVTFGPIQSLLLVAVLAGCGTRLMRSSIVAAGLIAVLPGYVTQFGVDQQAVAFGLFAVCATVVLAKRTELTAWIARAAHHDHARTRHRPFPARPDMASGSAVAGNGLSHPDVAAHAAAQP